MPNDAKLGLLAGVAAVLVVAVVYFQKPPMPPPGPPAAAAIGPPALARLPVVDPDVRPRDGVAAELTGRESYRR